MNSSVSGAGRGPGRPRDPAIDAAVLEATLDHLSTKGYARMSVDSIAETAGVTKPTIYRRWPSKADLVTAAIAALQQSHPPQLTGDLRADLIVNLEHFGSGLLRPYGMSMIGTLLVEEQHTPELIALFRERVVSPRRRWIRGVLIAGVERGELAADLDLGASVAMLAGAYYAQYLTGHGVPDNWAERIVDAFLAGVIVDNGSPDQ